MVTDSQRLGVISGQFIRAQRLCSVLETFKEAVQNVVLAAMRRGYKRGELDRMWGKFLVKWWSAEEVRRGELRALFRRMTRVVKSRVHQELNGCELEVWTVSAREPCRYGDNCRKKGRGCTYEHPSESAKTTEGTRREAAWWKQGAKAHTTLIAQPTEN